MKLINKQRLFYCLIISMLISGPLFIRQEINYLHFKKRGIKTVVFIKSINNYEATILQRAKYTSVAKIYYVTSKGDTIYDLRKNIWAMQVNLLNKIPYYMPLDSIIYDAKNPKDYLFLSDFRTESKAQSAFAYFLFGIPFFTIWLYLLVFIIEKIFSRRKKIIKKDF